MDSSLQSANLTVDELNTSHMTHSEETEDMEEPHIHLPNPSLWPLILSAAILVTVLGMMFLPDNPWLAIIGAPFILLGIMGWALEDPMAPPKEHFIAVPANQISSKFLIGQEVIDKEGQWVGTVQARFNHHILVERGGFLVKAYYVPHSVIMDTTKNLVVRLSVNENDLLNRGLDSVPDDLYEESPDFGVPLVKGTPLFARGPLSPAQTGHYNYGPNFPGINTDASGSYHHEDVRPTPQKYVGERRKLSATNKTIPVHN